jgi:hypothetical protein
MIQIKISRIWLSVSIAILGRWARYEITEVCYLPIAECYTGSRNVWGRRQKDRWFEWAFLSWEYLGFGRKRRPSINWRSQPNHAMRPVNWPARVIHSAFVLSLGGYTPLVFPDGREERIKRLRKKARELKWSETMYDFVETDEIRAAKREIELWRAKRRDAERRRA